MKNVIWILVFAFYSCVDGNKNVDRIESIQLNNIGDIEENLKVDVSHLFDSLSYVLLEINDSILISDISNLKESSQDYGAAA